MTTLYKNTFKKNSFTTYGLDSKSRLFNIKIYIIAYEAADFPLNKLQKNRKQKKKNLIFLMGQRK